MENRVYFGPKLVWIESDCVSLNIFGFGSCHVIVLGQIFLTLIIFNGKPTR